MISFPESAVRLPNWLALVLLSRACGCATYVTPGNRADLAALTAPELKAAFDTQPSSPFPAGIATIRIQAPDYSDYYVKTHGGTYGQGRFCVITAKEVEGQAQFERLSKLPQVSGLVGLSTLLLPRELNDEKDLRLAAARLKADLLLIYTFRTSYYTADPAKTLTVITLGLSPNQKVNVSVNISALLIDVRTGFIYGALESNERRSQITNAWQNGDAADAARRAAEKAAFEKLTAEFESFWPKVIERYARKSGPEQASVAVPSNRPADL